MAQRQIEEAEYQRLLGKAQVADLGEAMYNHPKVGKGMRALLKEFNPDFQIPDHDIRQEFREELDRRDKVRADAEREKTEKEQNERFSQERTKIQKEYGFTDEGMKDLEDFMLKENVGSYEVAASYRASKQPKQSDADSDPGREHYWNYQKQDGFAEIAADPEKWGHKEILKALRADEARERERR